MLTIYAFTKKKGLQKIKDSELDKTLKSKANVWIDMTQPTEKDLKSLSKYVNLHPITIEDILELTSQIKYESFQEYTFVVFRGIRGIKEDEISTFPLHLILSDKLLITAKNEADDIIGRVKANESRLSYLLSQGADFLFHHILDLGVDNYIPYAKHISSSVEKLGDEITISQIRPNFDDLFDNKRVAVRLRNYVIQMIDMLARLNSPSQNFLRPNVKIYFRDILDHAMRLNTSLKEANDEAITILNEHIALSSSKMNDIILVLTIFSAIMLPLTFITGLYGMNVNLPFAESRYSFFMIIGILVLIIMLMLMFFSRRRWLKGLFS